MLPYELNNDDIDYYWGNSILLWERKGTFIPVYVRGRGSSGDSNYPYALVSSDTGEKVVNVSIETFIKRCLIHFPPMGYADLSGVPVFISPRAGQNRMKGIDGNLMQFLSPVDAVGAAEEVIRTISDKVRLANNKDNVEVTKTDLSRRQKMLNLIQKLRNRRDGNIEFPNIGRTMRHDMIYQCVNRQYPSPATALRRLRAKDVVGVSIGNNLAIIRDDKEDLILFDRLTPVAKVIDGDTIHLLQNISRPMRECLHSVLPFRNIKL